MMMRDQIEAHVAEAENEYRKDPTHYRGFDWWQLSDAEKLVFAIDPERWPRMMVAIAAYDVFLELTDAEELGYSQEAVQRLRRERSDLLQLGTDPLSFAQFATAYAGLTLRDAEAAYWKNRFWLARTGHLKYRDEP